MPGRRRAAKGSRPTGPAAKGLRRRRPYWPATVEAGGSLVKNMASNPQRQVISVSDPAALATAAADRITAKIVANAGRVAICLSGGSSPKQLFQLLATDAYRDRIPWDRVHWFIGDERFVPADSSLNNMTMARQAFLDRCAPAANVHPIPTEGTDPEDA